MTLDLVEHARMPRAAIESSLARMAGQYPMLAAAVRSAVLRNRISVPTLLGHVVARVALELQAPAGVSAEYGAGRASGNKGECEVFFEYLVEDAGVAAAEAAVRIVGLFLSHENHDGSAEIEGLIERCGTAHAGVPAPVHPPSGVPIIAITGTNGKTTTTRIIAHILHHGGRRVGVAMTDGVWIDGRQVEEGDCAGPRSARRVLSDPGVEIAVLETARGGLLRSGLGFTACDVGIVTNVSADHLGLGGIWRLDQMARLKAVVPKSVRHGGYAILNADDDRVYQMKRRLDAHVALFSLDGENPRIREHLGSGGMCAICENGVFILCQGAVKQPVLRCADVPLTMDGRAVFMIYNILPAILAARLGGVGIEDIAAALRAFVPSVSQTPGRLNLFPFNGFTALVDFAHNTAGFQALSEVVSAMEGTPKIGIIAGLGDRRRKDNIEMGRIAAGMLDAIILRHDKNLRGGERTKIEAMVIEGIRQVKPEMPVTLIAEEKEAITHAVRTAGKGSLLVICCGEVQDALKVVSTLQNENRKEGDVACLPADGLLEPPPIIPDAGSRMFGGVEQRSSGEG